MTEIAPDYVIWGSDYPHRGGTWPFSRSAIDEQFRGIDESIKRKMLSDNVRRAYRITSWNSATRSCVRRPPASPAGA
jgi:predicted TIM-barrel fold metal-dependent hydrolase